MSAVGVAVLAWACLCLLYIAVGAVARRKRTTEQERADMEEEALALRAYHAREERTQPLSAKWRAEQRRREREACVADLRKGGDHAA